MSYWPRGDGEQMPARMTADWINNRLADMRAFADDDERAHVEEDALWEAVLRAIATKRITMTHASFLADMALQSLNIKFSRWHVVPR